MKKSFLYIMLICGILGCEERVDYDLETRDLDILVVEGMITSEKKQHEVRLTRPVYALNEEPDPVSGAVMAILEGQKVHLLAEDPVGSGIYKTDSIRGLFGKIYTLLIRVSGKEYAAISAMAPVSPLEPLNVQPVADSAGFYRIVQSDDGDPSMTEYFIDWSHLVAGPVDTVENYQARFVHYNLSTIDVNEIFKPGKERLIFPEGAIVYRKKHSLNEAHQAFIRTFLSETEWRGGLFDVQPGNVRTNLSEGAVGYFGASTVVSDQAVISP